MVGLTSGGDGGEVGPGAEEAVVKQRSNRRIQTNMKSFLVLIDILFIRQTLYAFSTLAVWYCSLFVRSHPAEIVHRLRLLMYCSTRRTVMTSIDNRYVADKICLKLAGAELLDIMI